MYKCHDCVCYVCVTMSRSVLDSIRETTTNYMYNWNATITKYQLHHRSFTPMTMFSNMGI